MTMTLTKIKPSPDLDLLLSSYNHIDSRFYRLQVPLRFYRLQVRFLGLSYEKIT